MSKFCINCGEQIKDNAAYCIGCGMQQSATMQQTEIVQTDNQLSETISASLSKGEVNLLNEMYPMSVGSSPKILHVIAGGVKQMISGFKAVVKDKKRLIPTVILAVTWLVLTLLPSLGLNPVPVKLLSWLTFAQGGLSGSVVNKIGDVIGKGLLASLLTLFLTDKTAFRQMKSGLSALMLCLKKEKILNATLLFGAGFALILYNIMVADSGVKNSMAGIACFVLSLRALGNDGGFLRRVFTSLLSGQKPINVDLVTRFMTGWTTGFALAVVISLIPIHFGGYLFGLIAILASIIMAMVNRKPEGMKI